MISLPSKFGSKSGGRTLNKCIRSKHVNVSLDKCFAHFFRRQHTFTFHYLLNHGVLEPIPLPIDPSPQRGASVPFPNKWDITGQHAP
jgi:hypothetical protein